MYLYPYPVSGRKYKNLVRLVVAEEAECMAGGGNLGSPALKLPGQDGPLSSQSIDMGRCPVGVEFPWWRGNI